MQWNRPLKADRLQVSKQSAEKSDSGKWSCDGFLPGVTYDVPYSKMFEQVRAALEELKRREAERQKVMDEFEFTRSLRQMDTTRDTTMSTTANFLFTLEETPVHSRLERSRVDEEVTMMQTPKRFTQGSLRFRSAERKRSTLSMGRSVRP